ncbi:hypothetical protein [Xenorhabdus bovienii]|uniref:hypothetical protein n=1 Tax=Xenorhabdus bovienii TaxID=40576 RepID=UPI0023B291D3|nr:hypothetical protein [Xenorhabdus bovienii]MDE9553587.1 hypothetical protein [Xenorhabdus bovienii]
MTNKIIYNDSNDVVIIDKKEQDDFGERYFQLYHDVFERVNETNKEITKSFQKSIKISKSDINELHEKIMQSITSLKGFATVFEIVSNQLNGETCIFKEFSEFEKRNTTSPHATIEVLFIYKFIMHGNAKDEFEKYEITIRLSSKIAEYEQAKKNDNNILHEIYSMLKTSTAAINIEYTDYVKARYFITTFQDWIDGVPSSNESSWVIKLKKIISKIDWVIILLILSMFSYGFIIKIPNELENSHMMKLLIMYSILFFAFFLVTKNIIYIIVKFLNRYFILSYLELNKGDENLLSTYESQNNSNIIKAILGVLVTIMIGMSTAFLYDIIKYIVIN